MAMRAAIAVLAVILLALSAGAAPAALAAPGDVPTVQVTIDQGPFTVGDRIRVHVEVRHPEGTSVTPPALETSLGPFEVLDRPRTDRTVTGDGAAVTTYEFTVASFQTGSLVLPPLEFTYSEPDGPGGTFATAPESITVESVLPDDGPPPDIRDLKPQADLPVPGSLTALWAGLAGLAALGVGAVSALAYRLLTRRRRLRLVPPPPASPEEVALAELERIAGLRNFERGDLRPTYLPVADCIRRYLTDRYGFPAVALTTTELRGCMTAEGVDPWQAHLAGGLLTECDEVLYAGYVPAPGRARGDLSVAFEIVELGRRRAEPVEEAAV